jgi:hypothetical protein
MKSKSCNVCGLNDVVFLPTCSTCEICSNKISKLFNQPVNNEQYPVRVLKHRPYDADDEIASTVVSVQFNHPYHTIREAVSEVILKIAQRKLHRI